MFIRCLLILMFVVMFELFVVIVFRQVGFCIYWLSNQGSVGFYEMFILVFVEEVDECYYVNSVDYCGWGMLDGDLLFLFKKVFVWWEDKQFIVLYMLGSYLYYVDCYLLEFVWFQLSIGCDDQFDIWWLIDVDQLCNVYDNSVFYIDFVIDSVIVVLEDYGGVVMLFYVVDYGEILFDGICKKVGYGFVVVVNYCIFVVIWVLILWCLFVL